MLFAHEVLGAGDPRDHFAVAAVQRESHVHLLAVPAADLEAVAAPAQVARERDHLAVVRPLRLRAVSREQQLLASHQPVDALWLTLGRFSRFRIAVTRRYP
jgi:hypothetical protein